MGRIVHDHAHVNVDVDLLVHMVVDVDCFCVLSPPITRKLLQVIN